MNVNGDFYLSKSKMTTFESLNCYDLVNRKRLIWNVKVVTIEVCTRVVNITGKKNSEKVE